MIPGLRRSAGENAIDVCNQPFHCGGEPLDARREWFKRAFAYFTLGDLTYEPGDMLWANIEFVHRFQSEAKVRAEFIAAGSTGLDLRVYAGEVRGDAVLRRA